MGNCTSAKENFSIDGFLGLPSPLPSWPPGDGFGMGTIDLDGLKVRQVSTFTKTWSTKEGGQDNLGVTFYNPSSIPTGYSSLGSFAQPNVTALSGWVLVGRDVDLIGSLIRPLDYTLVWTSQGSNVKKEGTEDGYFWIPVAPEGYKPAGLVVTASPVKPSTEEVRCVRSDFCDDCEKEVSLWESGGIGVFSLQPTSRGIQAPGVRVGTFGCNTTTNNTTPLSCLKNKYFTRYSSMPNLQQAEAMLREYSPLIYFHPDEAYLCSSVNFLFSNGGLLYSKDNPNSPTTVNLDGSNLPQGGTNDGTFWLDLPNGDKRQKVMAGELESSEVYVHVKPMFGGTFTDFVFWVFYPFNGPARAKVLFLSNISLGKIGEHVGDWEHVTLRISNFNGELWRVYFSQHSGGVWKDVPLLEFQDGTNKPVVYSSLNGHGFYPKPGLVLQGSNIAGIRNDTAKGKHIDTGERHKVISAEYLEGIVMEPPWLNYFREWGPKITYTIAKELNSVTRFMPGKLKKALENAVNSLPSEVLGEEGPSGPKGKGNWTGDEGN